MTAAWFAKKAAPEFVRGGFFQPRIGTRPVCTRDEALSQ